MIVKKSAIMNKIFAFLCFSNHDEAKKAYDTLKEKNPFKTEDSKLLYVNWAETRLERQRKLKQAQANQKNETNLFVKNLKSSVTKEMLDSTFGTFGTILSSDIKTPSEGQEGQSIVKTNFGFVQFKDKDDV